MTSLSANALMTPVQLCLVRACVPGPCGALRWASYVRDFSGLEALVPGDNFYRRGPGAFEFFFRAGGTLRDLHGCERKCMNFGRLPPVYVVAHRTDRAADFFRDLAHRQALRA